MSGWRFFQSAQVVFSLTGISLSFSPCMFPPMASPVMIDHQLSVSRSRITSEASSKPPEVSNSRVRPLYSRSYTTAVLASGHHTAANGFSPTWSLTIS